MNVWAIQQPMVPPLYIVCLQMAGDVVYPKIRHTTLNKIVILNMLYINGALLKYPTG